MYVENLATDTMGEVSSTGTRQTRPAGRRELVFALMMAIAMALVGISGESFWNDEGSSAIKAMQSTLGAWWHALLWEHNSNMQLPLYLLDVWVWEKVFGASERMLRLANVPFLLLTVYGLWLTFREDRVRFRFAVLFLLTNAFVWGYVNDARPYMLMLAGGTLLFAAIHRLQRDPSRFTHGWAWWFTMAALSLCATSMIAAPWAACAFCAAWYVWGRSFPIHFLRRFPVAFATLVLGMGGIGVYYVWSLRFGDVPSLGGTGIANAAFAVYDLFGFAGLGPSRLVMRIQLLGAFKGYYLPLALYGLTWATALIYALAKRPKGISWRKTIFYAITSSAVVIVLLAGYFHQVRVLPRYLTPALPLILSLGSYMAVVLWNATAGRVVIAFLLSGALVSSLETRFAARHAKEDYRRAVAIAKAAMAEGKQVYWAADKWTAIYYGLIGIEHRDLGSAQVGLYIAPDSHERASHADLIFMSRPDVTDSPGYARDAIQHGRWEQIKGVQSFEIWRRVE